MKRYNYIYLITNKLNGKIYIGKHSTDDLDDGYMGSGILIKKAIKKHGKQNFTKEILCFCDTKDKLNFLEKFYIKKYKAKEIGYNLSDGGDGGKISDDVCKRHSIYMKNYYKIHPTWNKGKTNVYSEEAKQKMRDAKLGRHLSEEQKKHQSETLKGHASWSKGKHWTHNEEIKAHYRHPKEKYKWITQDGEIVIMTKNHAKRYHPDWVLLDKDEQ